MKPSEAQGELLPGLGPYDDRPRPARSSRAVAAVALDVIADLRRKIQGGPDAERSPFLPDVDAPHPEPCAIPKDERGRFLRDKAGKYLDPCDWQPSDRPGWLICARCRRWMEVRP